MKRGKRRQTFVRYCDCTMNIQCCQCQHGMQITRLPGISGVKERDITGHDRETSEDERDKLWKQKKILFRSTDLMK